MLIRFFGCIEKQNLTFNMQCGMDIRPPFNVVWIFIILAMVNLPHNFLFILINVLQTLFFIIVMLNLICMFLCGLVGGIKLYFKTQEDLEVL
jgi:hypothetical protein